MSISLDVNLNLPETPQGVPEELFSEFRRIYNAIRLLSSYANTLAGLIAGGGGGTTTEVSQFVFGQEGEQGEQGDPIPGPRGEPGVQGIQGLLGIPGLAGEDGEDGLSIPGPQGIQGIVGPSGVNGTNGIPGTDGFDGEDGLVIPGPQGIAGTAGAAGAQGAQGPIGIPGEDIEGVENYLIANLNPSAMTEAKANVSTVAIANTETVVISYTCRAGELRAGTSFLFTAYCTQAGTNAATPTIRVRVGTTTLTGNIAATLTGVAGSSAVTSRIEALVTCRTSGAGGTIIGGIQQAKSGVLPLANAQTGTVAVDTTAQNMLVELTFISGQAANTYTFREAVVVKLVP